jgi:hypothetical protein
LVRSLNYFLVTSEGAEEALLRIANRARRMTIKSKNLLLLAEWSREETYTTSAVEVFNDWMLVNTQTTNRDAQLRPVPELRAAFLGVIRRAILTP